MIRKTIFLLISFWVFTSFSLAVETYIIDTPTVGILSYGSYNINFRCFSEGNTISKVDFGVLKLLNLGVSWEFDSFISNKNIKFTIPALSVKLKIYEGNMTFPAVTIGYDGQGYFIDNNSNSGYKEVGKGLYIVMSREFFIDGLTLSVGANINKLSKIKIYGFVNAIVPIYKEFLYFMAEYDNINYLPLARLNFGLKFSVTEYVDIDCIVRDCCGRSGVQGERVFKIVHSNKF
ncbi:MAG: hypothetical protein LBL77_03255 [Endomicrobium sp.]|jgi:hypothetical protein|nr:hypothetical protein [Endomicrobium sp.]